MSYNNYRPETNNKKVYVNPNFQLHGNMPQKGSSSMYINPLFSSHITTSINPVNKPKVYLNPNFINQYTHKTIKSDAITEVHKTENVPTPQTSNIMTKSRFCLVRHNTNSTTHPQATIATETTLNGNSQSTSLPNAKINSNKGTSLSNCLKNSLTVHPKTRNRFKFVKLNSSSLAQVPKQHSSNLNVSNAKESIHRNLKSNRFKFVKLNLSSSAQFVKQRASDLNVNAKEGVHRNPKMKSDKTKSKINIPCRLFRKYGTCLRQLKGHCKYLHNKKHVAICRKFLKGLCFDNTCLLSHEVSPEKMPTCYFYLKGMCTRNNCPYLHVKLNEKAKICTNFANGFCDKGDVCINSHNNICPVLTSKGVCYRKLCPYTHTTDRRMSLKRSKSTVTVNKACKKTLHRKDNEKSNGNAKESNNLEDCEIDVRYYQTVKIEGTPNMENIKPTRCKLGTLPSFIQL